MPTTARALLLVMLAAVACADPAPAPDITSMRGQVRLLSPASGARFVQNDPTIGCQAHVARGYGFRLAFDWDDVPGADRYDVVLWKVGAQFPAVNYHVTESAYSANMCNAFVIDANLDNWRWTVAAIGGGKDGAKADTLWSEQRIYGFEPCRHPDGQACTAPPPR